jgi:tRNA-dihydrouridine synthase B
MRIGNINIERPVILAPMEDVSDIPFRLICKELGADIMYTEFVNCEGLVRNSKQASRKMAFLESERPFGIQIYGGAEESMERAARMAEELNPDVIDINCGCWVRKVVGHGAGAGLLKDLPRMERIVTSVVKSVKLPVTVKTRLGWDSESIRIVEVAKMIEQAGAKGLTIHCRTRAQGHTGEPDYTWIPKVKSAVSIPIIVNGGISTPQDAKRVFDETGADGIMIARAAMHNPWIFRDIKSYLLTGTVPAPPSWEERVEMMKRHIVLSVEHKGERKGVLEFRKHIAGYLRDMPGISAIRIEFFQFTEVAPILDRLERSEEHTSELQSQHFR